MHKLVSWETEHRSYATTQVTFLPIYRCPIAVFCIATPLSHRLQGPANHQIHFEAEESELLDEEHTVPVIATLDGDEDVQMTDSEHRVSPSAGLPFSFSPTDAC